MLEDSNETELAPEGTSLIEDRSGENVDKGSTEAADDILNVLLNSPGDFERIFLSMQIVACWKT